MRCSVPDEIGVEPGDVVLPRHHGLGPMTGTQLDPMLRNLGVRTIVGVGVSVNIGITSLAFDAVNWGYQIVLAVGRDRRRAGRLRGRRVENTLSLVATVTTTASIVEVWSLGDRRGVRLLPAMANTTSELPTIPPIISVDDHVIEPAGVWQDRLPEEVPRGRAEARAQQDEVDELRRWRVLLRGGRSRRRRHLVRLVALRRPALAAHAPVGRGRLPARRDHGHADHDGRHATRLLAAGTAPRRHGRQPRARRRSRSRASRASAARRSSSAATRSSRISA